jgi:hypothetical protein
MDMASDGPSFSASWYLRVLGRMYKKRVLRGPMKPGFTLPRQAAVLLPEAVSDAEGVAVLIESVGRIQQVTDPKPHVVYGRMSRDEWDQLQFRHAELHLSFVVPE